MDDIPYVLQLNKRDMPNVAPVEYMNFMLNQRLIKAPCVESVANKGIGIYDCLNTTCKLVMAQFIEEHHMPTVQVPEAQNLAVKSS